MDPSQRKTAFITPFASLHLSACLVAWLPTSLSYTRSCPGKGRFFQRSQARTRMMCREDMNTSKRRRKEKEVCAKSQRTSHGSLSCSFSLWHCCWEHVALRVPYHRPKHQWCQRVHHRA